MRSCVFALLMLAAVVSAGVVDILKGASRPDPRKASLRAKANGAPMLSKSYQVQANLMITVFVSLSMCARPSFLRDARFVLRVSGQVGVLLDA